MSRKIGETWGTPCTDTQWRRAGGQIFITKIVASFMRTGPRSPQEYHRKLLQRYWSGDWTNPRFTGFLWIYRSFSTRLFSVQTLKS
ncbi:MAG: hypothetical protein ACRD3P_07550 [Terriglobales bacterium]